MRAVRILLFSLSVAMSAGAQASLGSLLFADAVGRGIRLVVVDGGLPDRMTLRKEEGGEDRLRKRVLALAGPERFRPADVQVLVDRVPPAWGVDQRSGGTLIRVGEVTYWRFLPGQVLPVRFAFEGQVWTLRSAALPGRHFPGSP